jgi:hypothetical protein
VLGALQGDGPSTPAAEPRAGRVPCRHLHGDPAADQVGDNALLIGKSTLELNSDGTGSISAAGATPVPIEFFVSSSCITIVETGDSECGSSGSSAGHSPKFAPGVYTRSVNGPTLTFNGIYDTCGGGGRLRNLTLAPGTYPKAAERTPAANP